MSDPSHDRRHYPHLHPSHFMLHHTGDYDLSLSALSTCPVLVANSVRTDYHLVAEWDTTRVGEWLVELNRAFAMYADLFFTHGIDGPRLLTLTSETALERLGISSSIHRRELESQIATLLVMSEENQYHAQSTASKEHCVDGVTSGRCLSVATPSEAAHQCEDASGYIHMLLGPYPFHYRGSGTKRLKAMTPHAPLTETPHIVYRPIPTPPSSALLHSPTTETEAAIPLPPSATHDRPQEQPSEHANVDPSLIESDPPLASSNPDPSPASIAVAESIRRRQLKERELLDRYNAACRQWELNQRELAALASNAPSTDASSSSSSAVTSTSSTVGITNVRVFKIILRMQQKFHALKQMSIQRVRHRLMQQQLLTEQLLQAKLQSHTDQSLDAASQPPASRRTRSRLTGREWLDAQVAESAKDAARFDQTPMYLTEESTVSNVIVETLASTPAFVSTTNSVTKGRHMRRATPSTHLLSTSAPRATRARQKRTEEMVEEGEEEEEEYDGEYAEHVDPDLSDGDPIPPSVTAAGVPVGDPWEARRRAFEHDSTLVVPNLRIFRLIVDAQRRFHELKEKGRHRKKMKLIHARLEQERLLTHKLKKFGRRPAAGDGGDGDAHHENDTRPNTNSTTMTAANRRRRATAPSGALQSKTKEMIDGAEHSFLPLAPLALPSSSATSTAAAAAAVVFSPPSLRFFHLILRIQRRFHELKLRAQHKLRDRLLQAQMHQSRAMKLKLEEAKRSKHAAADTSDHAAAMTTNSHEMASATTKRRRVTGSEWLKQQLEEAQRTIAALVEQQKYQQQHHARSSPLAMTQEDEQVILSTQFATERLDTSQMKTEALQTPPTISSSATPTSPMSTMQPTKDITPSPMHSTVSSPSPSSSSPPFPSPSVSESIPSVPVTVGVASDWFYHAVDEDGNEFVLQPIPLADHQARQQQQQQHQQQQSFAPMPFSPFRPSPPSVASASMASSPNSSSHVSTTPSISSPPPSRFVNLQLVASSRVSPRIARIADSNGFVIHHGQMSPSATPSIHDMTVHHHVPMSHPHYAALTATTATAAATAPMLVYAGYHQPMTHAAVTPGTPHFYPPLPPTMPSYGYPHYPYPYAYPPPYPSYPSPYHPHYPPPVPSPASGPIPPSHAAPPVPYPSHPHAHTGELSQSVGIPFDHDAMEQAANRNAPSENVDASRQNLEDTTRVSHSNTNTDNPPNSLSTSSSSSSILPVSSALPSSRVAPVSHANHPVAPSPNVRPRPPTAPMPVSVAPPSNISTPVPTSVPAAASTPTPTSTTTSVRPMQRRPMSAAPTVASNVQSIKSANASTNGAYRAPMIVSPDAVSHDSIVDDAGDTDVDHNSSLSSLDDPRLTVVPTSPSATSEFLRQKRLRREYLRWKQQPTPTNATVATGKSHANAAIKIEQAATVRSDNNNDDEYGDDQFDVDLASSASTDEPDYESSAVVPTPSPTRSSSHSHRPIPLTPTRVPMSRVSSICSRYIAHAAAQVAASQSHLNNGPTTPTSGVTVKLAPDSDAKENTEDSFTPTTRPIRPASALPSIASVMGSPSSSSSHHHRTSIRSVDLYQPLPLTVSVNQPPITPVRRATSASTSASSLVSPSPSVRLASPLTPTVGVGVSSVYPPYSSDYYQQHPRLSLASSSPLASPTMPKAPLSSARRHSPRIGFTTATRK